MGESTYSNTVETARTYYNSTDADNFYATIWGGEDIHVGLYEDDEESISSASRRTVERMASFLDGLDADSRVLDLGAGYGGAARYLAGEFGCRVVALNLSEAENERNRRLSAEQGLGHLIDVVDGNFEEIPFPDGAFDVVWSQDAILHSGRRRQALKEVSRVLKAGADFIFTDPMQADDCPEGVLEPILARIHLDSLGSPGFYRDACDEVGLEEARFERHTPELARHYARVLQETERREKALSDVTSEEYIARMKKGLGHWVEGGRSGHLAWGIFHFHKRR